ncbi:hypothetical protein FZ934_22980 (plasmid) [Rhizobium grahamii]|uniref:DUF5666 domain-containing protein n=1 Tax=Rhizobium grahamii TaxID=1120045 RepID=A0A5Q0CB84_9HYPH|nr:MULTISPECIES: hypothetical protein [Rhizobium]QFY63168.1 hypothetical protein FZ934_22980 [Rhizobium grahamii]QRM52070.1 hypothetical protein F3Y33_22670 [Rhizobium sp. BG6]
MRIYLKTILSSLALAAIVGVSAPHDANAADRIRVHGTVENLDGDTLKIKDSDGRDIVVKIASGLKVLGVKNASAADIKAGDFVGIGSQPAAGGINSAVQVVIFPASMKGTGEGDRPWNVRPNGSMTNAAVANAVKDVNGQTVTLAYKGGERKVSIPDGTKIVALTPATREDLKPGAAVSAQGVDSGDQTLAADRLAVGLDGATPPM